MPQALLIGLAAGGASALIFASASAGGMGGRVLLFFLAPLPCYLAALGWGVPAGAASAVMSAAGTGLLLGAKSGAVLFASQGLPLVILSYLALLSRSAPAIGVAAPTVGVTRPSIEWYPPGRIMAVATLLAGALACASVLLVANDLDQLRSFLRDLVSKVLVTQLPHLGKGPTGPADIDTLVEMLLFALPAGAATMWLGGFLLNLWLGGRITQISGRLTRPWPNLHLIRFPRGFGLGLVTSLLGTLLPGLAALLAGAFVGAFLFAYMLMGLAIIHCVTLGRAARPFILWGVYLSLVVLNPWSGLVVALIAILEPVLPWRRAPADPDPSSRSPLG